MSELDIAWAAGFIDGDGCFSSSNTGVFIRVAHTHKPTLDFLQKTFGGTLHEHNHGRPAHYKRVWRWAVWGDTAKEVALQLLPYLKEKKEQAAILINILDLRVGRGNKRPVEVKELRDSLVKKLSDLKK